jgi:hypothetical protein
MRLATGLVLLALSSGFSASADDGIAREKLALAQTLYSEREDLAKNELAIQALVVAEAEAQDQDLLYDVLLLSSRAVYWKGMHATTDKDRLALFEKAYTQAARAKEVNEEYADAYYLYGVALARWAETKGVMESLSRKKELFDNMEETLTRDARSGRAGEEIEGFGANRITGRVYFKLPVFAGGSRAKALENLKKAYEGAANYAINVNYYAEALYDGNAEEKKQACALLDALLLKDPTTINPDRVPETKEEFVISRKLRSEMTCR